MGERVHVNRNLLKCDITNYITSAQSRRVVCD